MTLFVVVFAILLANIGDYKIKSLYLHLFIVRNELKIKNEYHYKIFSSSNRATV